MDKVNIGINVFWIDFDCLFECYELFLSLICLVELFGLFD